MPKVVDLSWWSIIKFVIVIAGAWLLWLIRDVIVLGFIVAVIVAALSPVVDRWSDRINRSVAVALVFLIIAAIMGLIVAVIVPPLAFEIQVLSANLPDLVDQLSKFLGSQTAEQLTSSGELVDSLTKALSSIGSSLVATTAGIFSGLVALVTIIVLSFYMLLSEQSGRKLVANLLPTQNREKLADVLQKIGLKMGAWLRGQISLAAIIGVLDFLILIILGIPFALTLAFWAAVTELIPYIGPVLGAIPAVAIGFTVSPLKGFIVLIAYIIVQQLEANILVPKVMSKAVGLSPVVIIFAILIGAKLAGLIGIMLAVPAAAAISVLVQEWPTLRRKI